MVELKKLEVREGSLIMRKEDVSQTFFCYTIYHIACVFVTRV